MLENCKIPVPMTTLLTLHSIEDFDAQSLPDTDLGRMLAFHWLPLMEAQLRERIRNIRADLYIMGIDDMFLPIAVTDFNLENSYVCSIYNHYISYSLAELTTLQNPGLESLMAGLIRGAGLLLQAGQVDRAVYVNNWLLSTNLSGNLTADQIRRITEFLVDRFPDRAILWRSLNGARGEQQLDGYRQNHYRLLGSRQIYWFDPTKFDQLKQSQRWHIRRDLRLLDQYPYEVIVDREILLTHRDRLTELYNLLYIEKYFDYNPQFTPKFLETALHNPQFSFTALQLHGEIEGVVSFYIIDGVMTAPILGYNTKLPPQLGVYRLLSALLAQAALHRQVQFNESSGAASFKQNRGGVAQIEYTAIYDQHLPWHRQQVWAMLELIVDRVAIPLIKKYQL
jgi:hypothetical protein